MRKNLGKTISVLLASVLAAAALAGCGGQGSEAKSETKEASTPAAATSEASSAAETVSGDPIKIGFIHEASGAYEGWGVQDYKGFMCGLYYATDGTMEINGRPIEVIEEDTTGDVGVATQKATKLLEDDKVDVISGSCLSSIALAVMPLAEEYKTPYMVTFAAADGITGEFFNKYTFRSGRTLTMATTAGYTYMDQTFGIKGTTWVLLAPDYAGGHDGNAATKASLEERGATVLTEIYPPMDCADFTPYVQQVKDLSPDYLAITLVGNNFIAKLPQQLKEMGALEKTQMMCSIVDFDFLKTMGENGIGLFGECIYNYKLYDTPVNAKFIEIHKQLFNGELPDYAAGESFAAAQGIVEAIKKAGSTDADAIISALEGLEMDSIKGKVYFRAEDHQLMQPHAVAEIIPDEENGGTTVKAAYICSLEDMTFPVTAPGR